MSGSALTPEDVAAAVDAACVAAAAGDAEALGTYREGVALTVEEAARVRVARVAAAEQMRAAADQMDAATRAMMGGAALAAVAGGASQLAVAEALGVTQQTLWRWMGAGRAVLREAGLVRRRGWQRRDGRPGNPGPRVRRAPQG